MGNRNYPLYTSAPYDGAFLFVTDQGTTYLVEVSKDELYFNYSDKEVMLDNKPYKIGVSIEVLYFGTSDNINDTFDYMLKLRDSGWGEQDRDKILDIAREIKKDKN